VEDATEKRLISAIVSATVDACGRDIVPSHGTNRGSNPLRDAREIKELREKAKSVSRQRRGAI
jgi:hypothetical protein